MSTMMSTVHYIQQSTAEQCSWVVAIHCMGQNTNSRVCVCARTGFEAEYLGNSRRKRLGSNGPLKEMACGESDGHKTNNFRCP